MIRRVLESVLSSSVDRLWIIDNSPSDTLRNEIPSDSRVTYLHSKRNLGYGSANNIAIAEAVREGFKYHVVLNPDVFWSGDIVRCLMDYMDSNPEVALVMPQVFYPDGAFQYQAKLLPTPADLIVKRFLSFGKLRRKVERYELRDVPKDTVLDVPFLSGCFMFLRMSALKEVGFFDERYFMYHEDMDLSRRLHARYRTVYFPSAHIYHKLERESTKSIRLFFVHFVNMCRYFNKWGWFVDTERDTFNKKVLDYVSHVE